MKRTAPSVPAYRRKTFAPRALMVLFALAPHPLVARTLLVDLAGAPTIVYDPASACTGIDQPDMNPHAFRDASGRVTMFALHFVNRPLRGPDLDHLKIDCHVSLDSPLDADPAHFADRLYLAATWTRDGRDVAALVHEEYHADEHKRCAFKTDLACWYNTILSFGSTDGGETFTRSTPDVAAAAPFTQDVEQGRHRGFFEPSNMFGANGYVYAFVSTTGWTGQEGGSCLFRTSDPRNASLWRAYDGHAFSIRYEDPYQHRVHPKACAVIEPFTFSVGTVVRHEPSGRWLAVFQAAKSGPFPVDGFYTSSSTDLVHWEPARLLMAGQTMSGAWCKPGDTTIINYPAILDRASSSRNFDTIGRRPDLYYVILHAHDCQTRERLLVRRPLDVDAIKAAGAGDRP